MPDNSPGNDIQNNNLNTIQNQIDPSNVASSVTERKKTPVSLTLCTLALVGVAGSWMIAGYFVQSLQTIYPNPTMLSYICVASLQLLFVLVSVQPAFPVSLDETDSRVDLNGASDVYTNRETAKIALYLFIPFGAAFTLILKGLTLFPQSSYCGGLALQGTFTAIFVLCRMASETITRFKMSAVALMTAAAFLTLAEPALWHNFKWIEYASSGYLMLLAGIFLFALVWTLIARLTEHTSIQKTLIFAFIGLLWMLVGWILFIPLHLFELEQLMAFPPQAEVYWNVLFVVLLGCLIPVFLLQWTLTRTSLLFVSVGVGAIIPLHGVAEAAYRMEWNWVNFGASVVALAAIVLINTRYKA